MRIKIYKHNHVVGKITEVFSIFDVDLLNTLQFIYKSLCDIDFTNVIM